MFNSRKMIASVVIMMALLAAFLGFTKPGHRLLYQIGFSSACGDSCN